MRTDREIVKNYKSERKKVTVYVHLGGDVDTRMGCIYRYVEVVMSGQILILIGEGHK